MTFADWAGLTVFALVVGLPWSLGMYLAYCVHRYARRGKGIVDITAAIWNFLNAVWLMASQPQLMADRLGFPRRDMSETLGLKPDDGDVT